MVITPAQLAMLLEGLGRSSETLETDDAEGLAAMPAMAGPSKPNRRRPLKLMFGAMIRAAERWREIRITDFERRQIAAIREELNQEYRNTRLVMASRQTAR